MFKLYWNLYIKNTNSAGSYIGLTIFIYLIDTI
jgi:hypothetical protein